MKSFPRILSALALLAAIINQSLAQSNYEPYTFTTLAGGVGFKSPDVPGSAARFFGPLTVAFDSTGNVYVAEHFNHVISKVTPAGVVTALAGRPGSFGSTDGTGTGARFNRPSCATVDSTGNVYVADTYNHTIRKVTPAGVVTTLAGQAGSVGSANGTGAVARFFAPFGVAVDSAGNVYVADSDNHTIRKVTPEGVVTTLAGVAGNFGSANGTNRVARFNFPVGLVVDSATNIYVTESNHTIRKMTPIGTNWVVTTLAGLAGSSGSADGTNRNARFNEPNGVALDKAGNLYVAEWVNNTIRKMTQDGTNWIVTTIAGLAGSYGSVNGTNSDARFNTSANVAVDNAGNLYVADGANDLIRKMTPVGTNWVVSTLAGIGGNHGATDGPGTAALFRGPSGLAVDNAGNTYVADQINHTIRKVTPAGEVTTVAGLAGYAGSSNGTNGVARFNYPSGVAVDNSGNVFVAETFNHTIRKIRPDGSGWAVTTLAGSPDPSGNGGNVDGTGSAARFSFPRGLALDSAGNIYVADTENSTIRRVTPAGAVTTRAGSAGQYGSTDGLGGAARFNSPNGVAVDSATNIFVADTGNHTIRKITPARVVTTLAGLAETPGSVDGVGTAARFDSPSRVAVDGDGNLYVADAYNNSIRKVTPVGTNWVVTTLGGMPGIYGTADGTGSTARFSNPNGLAVDSAGNLYVADFYFNTIRKGFLAPSIVSSGPAFGFRGGHFGFGIAASAGKLVIIDASGDLANWQPILTNTVTAGLELSDPQSGNDGHRFYRFRLP